jgi:TonB family protein
MKSIDEMNTRFRLKYLMIIILLAVNNRPGFSQSEKIISKQDVTDTINGNLSNTYSSRKLIKFPMPEYTIADSGVVVVTVRINKNGRVVNAHIDKLMSTTKNKMLYNNALKAAAYAKYSPIDKDTVETGQLTYKFKLK